MSQREAAMVLLDAVSAMDHEGDTAVNESAVGLALQRLTEIDAITATLDDESGEVHVNVDPLLGASLSLITLLTGTLAEKYDADPDAVLATVRETASRILE